MTKLKFLFISLFAALSLSTQAQISGVITDAQTGDTILYPSASYKGNHVAVSGDANGRYRIARHNGWYLTFSAVGYQSKRIMISEKTPSRLDVKLKPDTKQLQEVVVNKKRGKYSRKDNPAVELMRRVIAAKKKTDLKNHDYYQYDKYQKITLAMNDIGPDELVDSGFIGKRQWLLDQVETCPYNNKLILPISVDETVSQHIYRRDPHDEKDIIRGVNSTGINHFIQTGDILNVAMKDVFTDVDIYDDQVRLLQYPFTSPIGKDAIAFYRFYIEDTVYVDRDLCYHLQFIPNNQQDFGFRGELFIIADSTLHVKRCNLTIPKRSDMNFVVVAQTLRFTCVVVSVPFLAMHMIDENATAVALEHGELLPWLTMVPLVLLGRFVGKKLHLPTKQLLGPILVAAIFSTFVQPFESAPKLLMAVVQLNIGLYIGTKLEKNRLLKLRSTLPNLLFGNAAMIAASVAMAVFLSHTYGFSLITAFLAMAPGGIAEMCLAGLSMGADVPQILTYQLFRLLFLNFTLPFAINLYFKKTDDTPPQTTN